MIVASHGDDEEDALARALETGVGYVALVASRRRGRAVIASLDVPDALREQIHTPAGLDIGARTPAEVAISILAQIIAERTRHRRRPRPRRGRGRRPPPARRPACCGMTGRGSSRGDASIHLDVGGERFCFCCEGCRSTFAAGRVGHAGD